MKHATHCKFCKLPITVTIEDSYAEHGDPLKLLPMACCNACADNRVERRRLERKVQLVARCLELSGSQAPDELLKGARKNLIKLTQDYAALIARWNGMQGMAWEDECVNLIMDKPTEWGSILGHLWKTFNQSAVQ